jgi:hypothetical protein
MMFKWTVFRGSMLAALTTQVYSFDFFIADL